MAKQSYIYIGRKQYEGRSMMSRKKYLLIERCSKDHAMTNEEIKPLIQKWFSNVIEYGQELQKDKTNVTMVSEKKLVAGDKK